MKEGRKVTNEMYYDKISMKGSHNSYDRKENLTAQITWNDKIPYDCGCGAVELDISQSSDGKSWSVGHMPGYRKDFRQLEGFLGDLEFWSGNNPGHDVITLHLDLKLTATTNFPDQLDQYIQESFTNVKVYTPGMLMGNASTLSQGALENGWPTLDSMNEQFIICLTGDPSDKEKYATTNPKDRLCFADKDTDPDEMPNDEHRVFFNFHIYHSERENWMKTFKACADKSNVITRAYTANSEDNWNDCLGSHCNIIATDKISNYEWAKVGNSRFLPFPS